ncbi:MAG TPA: VWA domain-containing protein, partial [Roseiflexaceae bacterium]|nr:VWA domain-containing protein [Roseiflexaceae bacterium]
MALLAPLALLSLLVIGPAIVAMYLLRLRREERRVSSTMLWQRMARDIEANTPWQRLRRSWLLLLQLLLLLLLALALARPFLLTTGISGRNLIIILDRSASMAAADTGTTRLATARAQAVTLVDQLPDGGRATLIAAGGEMEVPVAASTDRRQLYDAIAGVQLRYGGGSDLAQALTLAAALAAREPESEIAVISDGNVQIPVDVRVPATVRYFPIGSTDANVAVSAVALQPGPSGQVLFAQATNYGSAEVRRRLDIYLDGTLFSAYDLQLGAAGSATADRTIVLDVPVYVQLAEAILAESTTDALVADDRAVAVGGGSTSTNVRLVSRGNRFLETALGLLPGVGVTLVPTTTQVFAEAPDEVGFTILDGVVPPELPPGNLLFIAPTRSTSYFSVTGQLEFAAMRPAPDAEVLLRNVSVSDVSVLRAARITPGSWGRVIIDGDGGPLLVAGEREGRRIVIIAFALQDSDLPLQVAFPLLVANIVGYLAPGSGAEASQVAPDTPITLAVDPAIETVRVVRPDGRAEFASRQGGLAIYA